MHRLLVAALALLLVPATALADPCTDNGEELVATGDCQGVAAEGCCTYRDGLTSLGYVAYCRSVTDDQDNTTDYLCRKSCGATVPNCGWNPQPFGGFDFGAYECGIAGTAEPTGGKPLVCPTDCQASCNGKVCGPDNCSGQGFETSCGACAHGLTCSGDGHCVCQPSCENKLCGTNGCQGLCGYCGTGQHCDTTQTPWTCVGGCGCGDHVCGDDGCGSSCGQCSGGLSCVSGQCVCAPNCGGKQCGNDGCGSTCGNCGANDVCTALGQCCHPACDVRECGDDTCGGTCGGCPADKQCDPSGHCIACAKRCDGKWCGPDGCGGTCGTCDSGFQCVEDTGHCVPAPGADVSAPRDALAAPDATGRDSGGSAETAAAPDLPAPGHDGTVARDTVFIVCPAGQAVRYGVCVPVYNPSSGSSGKSGCGLAGGRAPSGMAGLLVLGLALTVLPRRRPRSRR